MSNKIPPKNNLQKNNPNSKTRKKRNRRRNKAKAVANVRKEFYAPCTKNYAQAMLDPFSFYLTGKEVCIPDRLTTPSLKFSTMTRYNFVVGTNGAGGTFLVPGQGSNDSQMGIYTTSAYTGLNTPQTVDTGVVGLLNGQYPYKNVDAMKRRLVACGLRWRYSGKELDRAGTVIPWSTGDHNIVIIGQSASQLLNRPQSTTHPASRAWQSVGWNPSDLSEFDYTETSFPVTAAAIGVLVSGGTPGTSWDVEFVQYWEVKCGGLNWVPGTTTSDSDATGFSRVMDYMGSIASTAIGSDAFKGFLMRSSSNLAQSYFTAPSIRYPTIEEL